MSIKNRLWVGGKTQGNRKIAARRQSCSDQKVERLSTGKSNEKVHPQASLENTG